MAADVAALTRSDWRRGGGRPRAAFAARVVLGRVPRKSRRGVWPRRLRDHRSPGADGECRCAPFPDRPVPRRGAGAARMGERRLLALRARDRRRRPRHAVAPHLRRARVAVHRSFGDVRLVRCRRGAGARCGHGRSCLRCRHHATHGSDHGGAEPGARRAHRRGAGAKPRQHHHSRDDRLSSQLCALGARVRARRTEQGLCDRRARGRRRTAAGSLLRPCCRTASLPSSCRRRSACRAPFSRRRRLASLALAPSRRRPNGARCSPTRANSSARTPGSSLFQASQFSSPSSPSI